MDHTIKTRLLLRPVAAPIGTIRLAGVNQGGVGVGLWGAPLRTLNCYSFNYILRGEGLYRNRAGRTQKVRQEDLVLFFPGIPCGSGTAPGEFWDEFWFEFEGPVFDLMRRMGTLDPRRPICHAEGKDYWFRRLFAIIPPRHLRQKTPAQVIVMKFVAVLTEMLAGSAIAEEPAPKDDWVEKACRLLADEKDPGQHQVAVVARQLGFSYENFRKRFRAAVGFSPGQFQLDARIDRAAALLYQGLNNVKAIAAELGFCDEFYFSRCFKRRFGQSPTEFRKRVRGGEGTFKKASGMKPTLGKAGV